MLGVVFVEVDVFREDHIGRFLEKCGLCRYCWFAVDCRWRPCIRVLPSVQLAIFYLLDEVVQESGSWVWGMSALLVEDVVLLVVCAV